MINNELPLVIRMGALPTNVQMTPQALADAIASRLVIVAQQSMALFVTGAAEPFSNVGPWLDTGTSPVGVWKNWSDITGSYVPITIIDEQRGYILSQLPPDPTKFKLWIELDGTGKAQAAKTFFGGNWTDIYQDKFAALQLAIDEAVTHPYGAIGTVYTSTGPATPPEWKAPKGMPVGAWFPYAGNTLPADHLWCAGQVVPIVSYPLLFTAIGTNFGGDGVSNFGIPNTFGRTVVGAGLGDAPDATNWAVGDTRGTETHVLTTPQLPAHTHTQHATGTNAQADGNVTGPGWLAVNGGSQTGSTGNGQAHPNVQPSIASAWIIKYQ